MPSDPNEWLPWLKAQIPQLPVLLRFMIGLTLFLIIPAVSRRLKVPGMVGLILAGVLLGPSLLDVWPEDRRVLDFFGEIGKLLILFYAGLEIDVEQFKRKAGRSFAFGSATLMFPLLLGAAVALAFGHGWVAALLIGSLIASHTLLGFPIVQRLGLAQTEAVMVTTGATIFTDVIALLILAVCVSIHQSGFSAVTLVREIVQVALYTTIILVVVGRVATRFIARRGVEPELQMLLILAIVAVCSVLAETIHLEPIVGAFLAGLAVSQSLRGTESQHHIEMLGNTLFVPAFFLLVGLTIDARQVVRTLGENWALTAALTAALLGGKFLAAWLSGWAFRYTRNERLNMWSLSLPQLAATLAAAMVAYATTDAAGRRLIDEPVLNVVLFLVLLTATLSPILTERMSLRVQAERRATGGDTTPTPPIATLPTAVS